MKTNLSSICLAALLIIHACGLSVEAQSSEPDIDLLISQLEETNSANVRIKAAMALGKLDEDPRSLKAVDALKSGLNDPNDEVRYQSLANLTLILQQQKQECPLEMLELVNDDSPKIKTNFPYLLDFYESYPPEALSFCLHYYKQLNPDEQPDALMLLGKAGGKDKRVMQILFDAVNSNNAHARVNGTVGLWAATHDFEILIPLYFDRLADAKELENLSAGDNGRFTGAYPRTSIHLAQLGVGVVFNGHLANRHDEFVIALGKFAASRDVIARRNFSNFLLYCVKYAVGESEADQDDLMKIQDCDYTEIRKIASVMADDSDNVVSENSRAVLKHIEVLTRK